MERRTGLTHMWHEVPIADSLAGEGPVTVNGVIKVTRGSKVRLHDIYLISRSMWTLYTRRYVYAYVIMMCGLARALGCVLKVGQRFWILTG
jgi:hypothetical protein